MSEHLDRLVTCRTIGAGHQQVRVGDLSWRPSVYGVVIKDGKVLLCPQWDGYDFPGGGVHEGEPILEALVREVKEESGIDVVPDELLLVQDDFFIHPRSGKPFHSILMYYKCEAIGGEISDAGFTEFEKTMMKTAEWLDIAAALEKARPLSDLKFYNPVDSPALIRKAAGL